MQRVRPEGKELAGYQLGNEQEKRARIRGCEELQVYKVDEGREGQERELICQDRGRRSFHRHAKRRNSGRS